MSNNFLTTNEDDSEIKDSKSLNNIQKHSFNQNENVFIENHMNMTKMTSLVTSHKGMNDVLLFWKAISCSLNSLSRVM